MLFNYFMLEISPDDMFFADTSEECKSMAREHRLVLASDEERPPLPAMSIYSAIVKQPDKAEMLDLLNSMDEAGTTVSATCIVYRQLVEFIAD